MAAFGIFRILSGNYLLTLLMLGGAGFLYYLALQEKKRAERRQYTEDNPHSSVARNVLFDDKLRERLQADRSYDPTNIELGDLQTGFTLDYDLKGWQVQRARLDYWKQGPRADTFTRRAELVSNEGERRRLTVHHGDVLTHPLTETVNAYAIDSAMDSYLKAGRFSPPAVMTYRGQRFFREPVAEGLRIDPANNSYQTIQAAEYLTEDRTAVIQIDCLDGKTLEARVGTMVDERRIGSILPGSDEAQAGT